jgi:hypothetical protein
MGGPTWVSWASRVRRAVEEDVVSGKKKTPITTSNLADVLGEDPLSEGPSEIGYTL